MSSLPTLRQVSLTLVFALAGTLAGAGGYTFHIARGTSYLLDDPQTCANCHVMREELASWQKSSHHAVATCNTCHTPHNIVGKCATKLESGYHHSVAFTLQNWHEPIRMRPRSVAVVLANCRHCHRELTAHLTADLFDPESGVTCITCHRDAGHAAR